MQDNKIIWIVGVLVVCFVMFGLAKNFIAKQAAKEAVQMLQKEYSPSPYGPGLDPDKIDYRKLPRDGH